MSIRAPVRPKARSFVEAVQTFKSGQQSPREFLDSCIEAIDSLEPRVQAFVVTNFEAARAAVDESTARWRAGRPLSAIDGMPVGVKDIMESADMPTGQGSPLFAGWRGGRDAAAVAALREAGAVVIGKTVTTEFALASPGKTRNPWDPQRTPGGTSSGSAASVGAGMIPAALGSQVAGSTIRPAGYCGCFGFKPSVGSINRGGSFDPYSASCTTVLGATLADTWNVAREIALRAGGDPGYPGWSGPANPPPAATPRRVAVLQTGGWSAATEDAKAELRRATSTLERAGIAVADRASDPTIETVEAAIASALPLTMDINAWEGRWPLNTYARDMDRTRLSDFALSRLQAGNAMTVEKYQRLLQERERVRTVHAQLRGRYDACVTLSAPGEAPLGLHSTGDPAFATPASLLGVPALSLPVLRIHNLPLGLQIIGFLNEDTAMFSMAASLLQLLQGDGRA
ncbi:MAG TPA: amidase [Burkholderiales bacterium]|nr:amidase [Burkholderiales bacterium]